MELLVGVDAGEDGLEDGGDLGGFGVEDGQGGAIGAAAVQEVGDLVELVG